MTRVTTTCPQCSTIFRVNPEQLAARRGQVRCGRCRHVFNGYETVSVGPDVPEVESAASEPASSRPWWARLTGRGRPRTGAAPRNPTIRPEGLTKMVELVRTGPDPAGVEPGALRIRPAFGIELERTPDDFALPAARRRRRLIRAGVALALLGLPVGLMLARNPIVQWLPVTHPLFATACELVHCEVPLPADADAWSVESNELLEDPNTPQLYHFTATLRNRSSYIQAYPNLDLSLTDTQGLAVERHTMTPAQYLPAGRRVSEGLQPNAEIAIRTDVKATDPRSQGYRVVLFFP